MDLVDARAGMAAMDMAVTVVMAALELVADLL